MIIAIRNGTATFDVEGINYRHIKGNILYNAMADHGIDKFTIEIIGEFNDEKLNAAEDANIVKYNTISPNGYNSTSGGNSKYRHREESIELMKQSKRDNIDNIRNEILQGLPPYTAYGIKKGYGEFIRFQKHPLCGDKYFYVKTYGSLENAKKSALEFFNELTKTGEKYTRPKKDPKLPKGLKETKKGYKMDKHIVGKAYRANFEFEENTREENRRLTIEHYENLMKTIEIQPKVKQEIPMVQQEIVTPFTKENNRDDIPYGPMTEAESRFNDYLEGKTASFQL